VASSPAMNSLTRLGGGKVLKGVAVFSILFPSGRDDAVLHVCRAVAEAGINLPYVTLARDGPCRVMSLAVEYREEDRVRTLLQGASGGRIIRHIHRGVILSLFPHQSNPRIPAAVFEAFARTGPDVEGIASSASAVSLVLREEDLDRASRALFDVFAFRTHAGPDEWKASQEGKEALYKEVVASYQEKRPKVYGVTCRTGQGLVSILLHDHRLDAMAPVLTEAAERGLHLGLITSCPSRSHDRERVTYCLPLEGESPMAPLLPSAPDPDDPLHITPAAVFAMNGPHFGDRYGITSGLLGALDRNHVRLLALNCTVATITGAVPASELDPTLAAIQGCFDVPSVLRT